MSDPGRIAVVGLSCRFPGAPGPDEFWRLLREGREAIRRFTREELAAAGVEAAVCGRPEYVPAYAVLDGIEQFDAGFFGMPPREAAVTDPQQRIFLELAWEALEHAGYDSEQYDGRVGVYAGAGLSTYLLHNLLQSGELRHVTPLQVLIANNKDYVPTRVSYRLNLRGPSISVNTACSTSLVAVHVASQALLNRECDMALAGGVGIQVPQDRGYLYEPDGILSPDGRCRAFAADAAGTVSGNGGGAVVLKRLEDAQADGDTIHAVILGTAVNNDGALKVGYTAPSLQGQANVIAEALAVAGVPAESISYVEAHGTGTAVGDPIEVQALAQVFRSRADGRPYCAIGSVKTNVGHLDEGAGVAGLIKTILALQHREIPASLHYDVPNPACGFDATPLYVNAALREWTSAGPRRAGVSSFGIGGTNAHAVLEETAMTARTPAERTWYVLPLAARSPEALAQMRHRLAAALKNGVGGHLKGTLADVAYTLQVGRRAFEHRQAFVCRSLEDAVAQLEADGSPASSADDGSPEFEVARRWVSGAAVEWASLWNGHTPRRIPLPTYPFERKRHWIAPAAAPARAQHEKAPVDEWLYRPAWVPVATPPQPAHDLETIVLFASADIDRHAWTDGIEAALEGRCADVVKVVAGHAYRRHGARSYEVRPGEAADYDALIADLARERESLAVSFVHLWLLTGGRVLDDETILRRGFDSLLCLARSLGSRTDARRVRLAVGSDEACAVRDGDAVRPEKAAVSGLLRAIAVEYPSIAARHVDVAAGTAGGSAIDRVVDDLLDAAPAVVAHRGGERLRPVVERLTPRAASEATDAIRDDEVYLITGGLGSMGLAFAEWIAAQAKATIVLTSRRQVEKTPAMRATRVLDVGTPSTPLSAGETATLDRLCGRLLLEYLAASGIDLRPGTRTDETTVCDRLRIVPAYRKMLGWCLDVLAADGVIERRDGAIHGRWDGTGESAEALAARIRQEMPTLAGLADLVVHCAAQFPSVFSGERAGTEAIYPDGTPGFLESHTAGVREHSYDRACLDALAAHVAAAAAARPGHRLRVLEVGGGTGTLTDALFKALSGTPIDFTFTDVSRAFVSRAREEAVRRGVSMSFGQLDISRPPEVQGYEPNTYDLVLAYNVVHATHDLPAALAHLKRLLVPGGELCVVETVTTRRWDQMIWGLTSGWWTYDDGLRTSSPLLGADGWERVLRAGGFEGVISAPRVVEPQRIDAAVIIGRTPLQAAIAASAAGRIAAIEARGSRVHVVPVDIADRDDVALMVADVRARFGRIAGVIHTAGVIGRELIARRRVEDARRVLAPKLGGARALEAALGGEPPDFFVACSSMASRHPVAGQADYAAANAALDAFAHHYRRRGTRAVTIGWGFWQELGMIAKSAMPLDEQREIAGQIRDRGWSHAGVEAFDAILRRSADPEVMVYPQALPVQAGDAAPVAALPDLLSDRRAGAGYVSYRVNLTGSRRWIIDEHRVGGVAVLPGTAYLEIVRAAFAIAAGAAPIELRDIFFVQPFIDTPAAPRELRVVLQDRGTHADGVVVSSAGDDRWTLHARGTAALLGDADGPGSPPSQEAAPPGLGLPAAFARLMSGFGPRWDNVIGARFDDAEAVAVLRLPEAFAHEAGEFGLHPALLDNATGYLPIERHTDARVPFSYDSVRIYAPLTASVVSRAVARGERGSSAESFDVLVCDEAGRLLVDVRGYRLRRLPTPAAIGEEQNAALRLGARGSLDTLRFQPADRDSLDDDEVEVRIEASGMNFIEVLYALGLLPDLARGTFPFGLEGAGVVTRIGARVISVRAGQPVAVFANGTARLVMKAPERCVMPLPNGMSMEDAATIPAAFMTAYTALIERGRLERGERVLIHSACGGVGLAAIQVARWRGAEILATAGTEEKRAYLRSMGIATVMDSRSPVFAADTMAATDGRGVDVVLNALSGELLECGLSVLAPDGRFLDLGKRDILGGGRLPLQHFARRLSYMAIDVGPDMRGFTRVWREVWRCVADGDFTPLPRRVLPASLAADAFSEMARGRHIGKFVLTFADRNVIRRQAAAGDDDRGRPLAEILGLQSAVPGPRADAAASGVEQTIAAIWEDLLGVSPIARDADFFELDGDSLLGAQVIARISSELGARIPLSAIFDAPTVAGLAALVERVRGELEQGELEEGVV